jgi:hypothetical protein
MTVPSKRLDHFNPLRFCAPVPETPADRHHRIQEAAYRLAVQRGFAPGHDVEDWLAAEREVDIEIAMGHPNPLV